MAVTRITDELMLDTNKAKGISPPGTVSGITYKDSAGKTRNKYETKSTITPTTVKALKAAIVPPVIPVP